jgi:predicted Zn-dependent protease
MSEAPGGGQDSQPGEHPPAGPGRQPHEDAYSWYRRGMELLGRGSAAAAAQVLGRAAEAEPASRSILEALGRAQFDAGRYTAAAESFRRIVEASPSDDYAQFGLGLALARLGNPAGAAEHLALAAAMRPELPHYTKALRGVRATLRARQAAAGPDLGGPGSPPDSGPDLGGPDLGGPGSGPDRAGPGAGPGDGTDR